MKSQLLLSDILLVAAANLVNLLISGVFVARGKGASTTEYWLGLAAVSFAIPVAAAAIWNLKQGRDTAAVFLPLLLVLYLVAEFVLDYWLKVDFRSSWLLWPYIVLFYAGVMAMIGYGFMVGRVFGFITLATFYLNLGATWWSHTRQQQNSAQQYEG